VNGVECVYYFATTLVLLQDVTSRIRNLCIFGRGGGGVLEKGKGKFVLFTLIWGPRFLPSKN